MSEVKHNHKQKQRNEKTKLQRKLVKTGGPSNINANIFILPKKT